VVHDWVATKGGTFAGGAGPVFGPGYHLNYWMSQDWVDTGLARKLDEAYRASRASDVPDARVLHTHLFDFPFARG
jgi:hypothetical protein